ncbi:MAG: Uma2 family endonuclease [Planctomycetia bacterium]
MTTQAPMPDALKPATLDDLLRYDGKAELIAGRIVPLSPTGFRSGFVAYWICGSLTEYAARVRRGLAVPDPIGFAVSPLPSGRQSFSPDAAYYTGESPVNDRGFIVGAPDFAVEVRSEFDYGRTAETAMARKRDDYFYVGTLVVWDVDPDANEIRVYRPTDPKNPKIYGAGESAEAEPAVPGWRFAVDRISAKIAPF